MAPGGQHAIASSCVASSCDELRRVITERRGDQDVTSSDKTQQNLTCVCARVCVVSIGVRAYKSGELGETLSEDR